MSHLKTCFKCNEQKPLDEFYKHSGMSDGRIGKCKECTKKDVRENYRANIDKYKAYEKSRANLPHRVKARKEYAETHNGKKSYARAQRKYNKTKSCRDAKRRYIQKNPLKRAAHVACNNAIRDGRIKKFPCEICGKEKAQAHHDDYSKPLDVRWLCTKHHAEWHKNNTPICPDQITNENLPLAQDRT